MTAPAPRALLLDYGGVLTTSIRASFGAFCDREGFDGARFLEVLARALGDANSPAGRIETGALATASFETEFADLLSVGLGVPVEPTDLTARMFASVQAEPRMIEAAHAVRASGVTTVLVSNSWGGFSYDDRVIADLFDHVVISGQVKMRKPDAGIYEHAAALAGCAPHGCLFIDDLPLNCDGATRIGMRAHHHVDPDVTIGLLEDLFEITIQGAEARQ